MNVYLPDVAWSSLASDVAMGPTPYRYYVTVHPLDYNEPGTVDPTVAIGDWFLDYVGYPFLVEDVNGSVLTVYDINERGDGVYTAFGPYANQVGYVYRAKNNGFLLSQAQLRKLDSSASDIIKPIENGVLWSHRGISIWDETNQVYVDNITRIKFAEDFTITENTIDDPWTGGKIYDITVTLTGGGNSFKTWHLAADTGYTWGTTDVVAAGTDTMDFIAGNCIAIDTDATAKALRIRTTGSTIAQGSRTTGYHSGLLGETVFDDDYLYVCVVEGAVGVAVWKRVSLMRT